MHHKRALTSREEKRWWPTVLGPVAAFQLFHARRQSGCIYMEMVSKSAGCGPLLKGANRVCLHRKIASNHRAAAVSAHIALLALDLHRPHEVALCCYTGTIAHSTLIRKHTRKTISSCKVLWNLFHCKDRGMCKGQKPAPLPTMSNVFNDLWYKTMQWALLMNCHHPAPCFRLRRELL